MEVLVMIRFKREASALILAGVVCVLAGNASAQTNIAPSAHHVAFDSPDGWALQYFTSATLLSGLQPPEPLGEHRQFGSVTLGLELGWLPALSPEQTRVGFGGRSQEDLNKAPIIVRPSVRIGLPWRFSVVAAVPPPLPAYGVTPRLVALGL